MADFKAKIAACVAHRESLLKDWRENVAFRVMQPFGAAAGSNPEAERVAVTEDWTRSRQKVAQLSFTLPKIVAVAGRPESQGRAPAVTAAVNQILRKAARAQYAVDECLSDVVNASGIMAAVVRLKRPTATVALPALAPAPVAEGVAPEIPTQAVPLATTWSVDRISPADLLWDTGFRGSDWDKAAWVGYTTRMSGVEIHRNPVWDAALKAAHKNLADTKDDATKKVEHLANEVDGLDKVEAQGYAVQTVFYKAWLCDADAKHPDHLRFCVYIDGVDEPVEKGDVAEQAWVPGDPATPGGRFTGLTKFPVRIETLTYVSDLAIPPSDSRAGRTSVLELMRHKKRALRQGDSAIPIRWYDVNRLDEEIAQRIKDGEQLDMIPVNGPGDRVIGEVARANYPRDNVIFQQQAAQELDSAWALSKNQAGALNQTERSAEEVRTVAAASDILLDYQKNKVARFVAGIAEVVWMLASRFQAAPEYVSIIGQDGAEALAQFPSESYSDLYDFEFVPNSADRVDITTRQAQALKRYNVMAKSPSVNRIELEKDIFRLEGLDADKYVKAPAPGGPEDPNISYRLSGEDFLNPIAIAVLMKTQQITPDDITAAAMLIKDAMAKAATVPAPSAPPGPPAVETPREAGFDESLGPVETINPIVKRASDGSRLV